MLRDKVMHGLTPDASYVWSHTLGTTMGSSGQQLPAGRSEFQNTTDQSTRCFRSSNCIGASLSDLIQAHGSVNPICYAPAQIAGNSPTPLCYLSKTSFAFSLSLQKQFWIKERRL